MPVMCLSLGGVAYLWRYLLQCYTNSEFWSCYDFETMLVVLFHEFHNYVTPMNV